jgi:hypothetical protein
MDDKSAQDAGRGAEASTPSHYIILAVQLGASPYIGPFFHNDVLRRRRQDGAFRATTLGEEPLKV